MLHLTPKARRVRLFVWDPRGGRDTIASGVGENEVVIASSLSVLVTAGSWTGYVR